MTKPSEIPAACVPRCLKLNGFNPKTVLPYGLKAAYIRSAMQDFLDFLGFVNTQLHSKGIERLETMLMAANFSSMVGEFMGTNIPKYCDSLARNRYHNGHPDLIPAGIFDDDAVQHSQKGIEIKASRYDRGWQGHNPEKVFLMVFVFESNGPQDDYKGLPSIPFRFKTVVGANLKKTDWKYSGRSASSRRTITASVAKSGYEKMKSNWIYNDPVL